MEPPLTKRKARTFSPSFELNREEILTRLRKKKNNRSQNSTLKLVSRDKLNGSNDSNSNNTKTPVLNGDSSPVLKRTANLIQSANEIPKPVGPLLRRHSSEFSRVPSPKILESEAEPVEEKFDMGNLSIRGRNQYGTFRRDTVPRAQDLKNHTLTKLLEAAKTGDRDTIRTLLKHGTDVKLHAEDGIMALHVAVSHDEKKTVALLLESGASLTDVDGKKNNVFHLAARRNHDSTLKELLKFAPSHEELLEILNSKNRRGKSSLHLAATHPDSSCLDILLEIEGINLDITTKRKQTPLHIAISYSNEIGALKLIEKGAKLDIKDKYGNTPLHLASFYGLQTVVLHLVKKFTSSDIVNSVNNDNKTALHLALEQEHKGIADILTKNGAEITIEYEFYSKRQRRQTEEEITQELQTISSSNIYGEVGQSEENIDSKQYQKKKQQEISRSLKYSPMLKKWNTNFNREPKKLKTRLMKGFPFRLRGELWTLLFRIKEIQNPDEYFALLPKESPDSSQIHLDVIRTFRNYVQFNKNFSSGQISLFNICKAFSLHCPKLGYVQGMSGLGAILLMNTPEPTAFWILTKLLTEPKYQMYEKFLPGFPGVQKSMWIYEKLLQKYFPKIHSHLMTYLGGHEVYVFKWFLVMFSDLPMPILLYTWDVLFYEGGDLLYSISLAVIKAFEHELLNSTNPQFLQDTLKGLQIKMEPEDFVKLVFKFKFERKKLQILEEEFASETQKDKN